MSAPEKGKHIEVLIVEDNPGDWRLILEGLKDCRVPCHLHWIQDGVEALAFLRGQGKYAGLPRPNIILLDLNLPKKNGREVLVEIKADSSLKSIPVVVLTTSQSYKDVQHAYEMQANCYITKPLLLDEFLNVVKRIEQFWFGTASLPIE